MSLFSRPAVDPNGHEPLDLPQPANVATATFALGCFWGPDARFGCLDGVIKTRVGYSGGTTFAPAYHRLGDHSETIQIDYDPTVISYRDLLAEFFANHTSTHPQHSVQYRSAVFYRTEDERRAAEEAIARLESMAGRVYTAIEPFRVFHMAEDYHQKYYYKQWAGRVPDRGKLPVGELRAAFHEWYGA